MVSQLSGSSGLLQEFSVEVGLEKAAELFILLSAQRGGQAGKHSNGSAQ